MLEQFAHVFYLFVYLLACLCVSCSFVFLLVCSFLYVLVYLPGGVCSIMYHQWATVHAATYIYIYIQIDMYREMGILRTETSIALVPMLPVMFEMTIKTMIPKASEYFENIALAQSTPQYATATVDGAFNWVCLQIFSERVNVFFLGSSRIGRANANAKASDGKIRLGNISDTPKPSDCIAYILGASFDTLNLGKQWKTWQRVRRCQNACFTHDMYI